MNRLRRLWRSRILRFALALVAVMAVLVGFNIRLFTSRLRDDKVVTGTESTVLVLLDLLKIAYETGGIPAVQALLERRLSDHSGSIVFVLRDAGGTVLATNLRDLYPPEGEHIEAEALARLPPVGRVSGTQFEHVRSDWCRDNIALVYRAVQFPDGLEAVVGLNTGYLRASVGLLEDTSALTMYTVAIVGVGALLAVGYLIYRLNLIADTTREIIETGDLARRIPVRAKRDDFGELATLLNTMLARIEAQMDGVRHVADGIAHDLRTPLTRLRNRLEALRAGAPPTADRATLDSLLGEADNLLGIFNALLHIANLEQGRRSPAFAPIDTQALIADLAEAYEPLAHERGLALTAAPASLEIRGEKHLLFQALANLVDNAIKFTPPGGRIAVAVRQAEERVLITVADSGPGVPAAERENVFTRFHRLDSSRHLPGNGLGLSLVQAVVHLHRGRIRLADNAPGLLVEIELPAAPTAAPHPGNRPPSTR